MIDIIFWHELEKGVLHGEEPPPPRIISGGGSLEISNRGTETYKD